MLSLIYALLFSLTAHSSEPSEDQKPFAGGALENGCIIYRETEHQELWYPGTDPAKPLPIHVPSALGALGYYVCVRIPEKGMEKLSRVQIKINVAGLYPTKLHLQCSEGVDVKSDVFPSSKGYVWKILARAYISRGRGEMEFINWPSEITSTDLLLCTWPRYVDSGQADDWLECHNDPQWTPTGIPLGGIGCGRIDLCRDGRFRNFSGNNNQDMPLENPKGLEGAYLAVQTDHEIISLSSMPFGGTKPYKNLRFEGRFPQAKLTAGDLNHFDVKVQATGMFLPHDMRMSSVPGVLFRWKIQNKGNVRNKIRCIFNWPNVLGVGGGIGNMESNVGKGDGIYWYWEEIAGRKETRICNSQIKGVVFENSTNAKIKNSQGRHLIAVLNTPGAGSSTNHGEGRVWYDLELPAGESKTLDMVMIWMMPHWEDTNGIDRGHYWQNYYSNAEEMATEVLQTADYIMEHSGSLNDLLAGSELPDWMQQRLANCNYPLITNSVWFKDGRFSMNEGPTEMSGIYGTIDQRLGAHPSTQLFYPELNSNELKQFAHFQGANGMINHDLGSGNLDKGPSPMFWPDLICSFTIQCARHAWSMGDTTFDREMWDVCKKAVLVFKDWARSGDGLPMLGKVEWEGIEVDFGSSYDGYHYEGTSPYIGSLWLATLNIMEKWATRMKDEEMLTKVPTWRNEAIERMNGDLWNGSFYKTCANRKNGYERNSSFSGMLAGQPYSIMLAGKDILPADRLRHCIDALFELNCNYKFHIPPDEVSPDYKIRTMFGWWPYIECFGLSAAATTDDSRVMKLWEKYLKVINDDGKRLCDTRLMYCPETGEASWGAYYMTAPASWILYNSLIGYFYEPLNKILTIAPQLKGKFVIVDPQWWGIAQLKNDVLTLKIEKILTDRELIIQTIQLLKRNKENDLVSKKFLFGNGFKIQKGAELVCHF